MRDSDDRRPKCGQKNGFIGGLSLAMATPRVAVCAETRIPEHTWLQWRLPLSCNFGLRNRFSRPSSVEPHLSYVIGLYLHPALSLASVGLCIKLGSLRKGDEQASARHDLLRRGKWPLTVLYGWSATPSSAVSEVRPYSTPARWSGMGSRTMVRSSTMLTTVPG